jgi:ribosomal protein L37AE/L43A
VLLKELRAGQRENLRCPYCNSPNILYRHKAPHYWCRRCGTTWNITNGQSVIVEIMGPAEREGIEE